MRFWQSVWTIARKDIGVWLRQPTAIAATILPAVGFFVVLYFGARAVGRNPVALVVEDSGPRAQQLVSVLEQSDAFIVRRASASEAAQALARLDVSAVITIPAGFDAAYVARQPDPVTIRINNLNLDFTNDLRRSLPRRSPPSTARSPTTRSTCRFRRLTSAGRTSVSCSSTSSQISCSS